ncbi:hypothetical protein ABTP95_22125, partial [Acinetobacter baumannii]
EVRKIFQARADDYDRKLKGLPQSWLDGRVEAQNQADQVRRDTHASLADIKAASRALSSYPKSPEEAERKWTEARAAN